MCVRACIDYIVFMLVNIRLWVNSGSMEHTQIPLFPTRPITPTPRAEEFGYTDPAIVQQITDNPLGMGLSKLRLVTARSLAFQACEWIFNHLKDVETPFLILHAGDDRITDPKMSQLLHDIAKAEDKAIILFEGAQHGDMFHGGTMVRDLVQRSFNEVDKWISARI
eukprot:m.601879 g.601879  ORF g.601879 m.601879 type:complete len:166 (-) comp22442_c0_seq47:715-1212(-)